jgi:hypothetical protein
MIYQRCPLYLGKIVAAFSKRTMGHVANLLIQPVSKVSPKE